MLLWLTSANLIMSEEELQRAPEHSKPVWLHVVERVILRVAYTEIHAKVA